MRAAWCIATSSRRTCCIAPDGSLRITDFGLALALRGQGRFGGATSQSGTPQFASPEQLLGERVDQRSDLYSLAAVAYYALLGDPALSRHTPEQVLARQTTNQLPDCWNAARMSAPRTSQQVLDRALSASGRSATPSAAEFLQALNRATGARGPAPERVNGPRRRCAGRKPVAAAHPLDGVGE